MSDKKPTHTLEELITDSNITFLLFGGKGGVGKTSCACASALAAALLGKRVLIISTDPAHSTTDSFYGSDRKEEIGSTEETKIYKNNEKYKHLELYGLEIVPKKEYEKYQEAMEDAQGINNEMVEMSRELMGDMPVAPGTDETFGFAKVIEYVNEKKDMYDLIIFDTAPTGHTLRLLDLPGILDSFFGKMVRFRLKMGHIWGKLKSAFGGGGEDKAGDTLEALKHMKKNIEEANKYLKNPENPGDPIRTNFVPVTIAEMMGVYETERLIGHLYEVEMPTSNIIINQLMPENPDCGFCVSRKEMQVKNLENIKELYEDEFNLTEVPLFDTEINGPEKLLKFAKRLYPSLLKDY